MKAEGLNHNDFLNFQIARNMMNQAKDFLMILEDFKKDNILSEEYYARLRSKILGTTNDKIRDLKEAIDQFDIELRKT